MSGLVDMVYFFYSDTLSKIAWLLQIHLKLSKLFWLLFFLFLAGCSPNVSVIQPSRPDNIVLKNKDIGGQSFVAKYDGLNQIKFFIRKATIASGSLTFTLSDPSSGTVLFSSIYSLTSLPDKGYFSFEFPEISDSNQKYFMASILYEGPDSIKLGAADGAQYINGSAYLNGLPIDSQAAFQLGHQKWTLFLGLFKEFSGWLLLLAIGVFLFVIPGWGILSWALPDWQRYDRVARLLFSMSFTLALIPIIFLWVKLFQIPLGSWLPVVLLIIGLILIGLKNRQSIKNFRKLQLCRQSQRDDLLFHFIFGLVISGVIFTRFWVVRNLDLPLWGDSYHHSLIVQLLDDHKGLFDDWLPYADLYGLSYHYGFHAITVVYKWLVGYSSPQTILFFGQLLNIMAVVALYPLAKMIGQNRWAGLAAVLISGLFLSMPNSYTNWGRYTQLTGQVLLPTAVLIVWILLNHTEFGKSSSVGRKKILQILLVGWVIWCGLALIHIRVAVFAAAALPFLYLMGIDKKNAAPRFIVLLLLAFGSLVLFLPWLPNIIEGQLMNLISHYFNTPVNSIAGTSIQESDKIHDLFAYIPAWAWLLLLISLGWGLWKRTSWAFVTGGWWLLVTLLANPGWIGIPGNGAITNFALVIAFYIPVGLLIGASVGWFFDLTRFSTEGPILARCGLVSAIILATLLGVKLRVADINIPQNALSVRPDIVAAEWIQENTPDGSRFYVNSFFAYGGTLVVGSDGGWWLPLLANRSTTLPPLTYGIESGPIDNYIAYVNYLVEVVQEQGFTDPDVIRLLQEYGVTHIYIGQQQGTVNAPAGTQIKIDDLLLSVNYNPIYHVDRVWIFELVEDDET